MHGAVVEAQEGQHQVDALLANRGLTQRVQPIVDLGIFQFEGVQLSV